MAVPLRWTRPRVVAEWEWERQNEGLPELRRVRWFVFKWAALLGVPFIYACYRLDPSNVWLFASAALLLPFGLWLQVTAQAWGLYRSEMSYDVRDKGLRAGYPVCRLRRWKQIEGYGITDHPQLTGVRCLRIKLKRFRRWARWCFDPSEVDEARLRALLEEHLPGKCWDNVPEQ